MISRGCCVITLLRHRFSENKKEDHIIVGGERGKERSKGGMKEVGLWGSSEQSTGVTPGPNYTMIW